MFDSESPKIFKMVEFTITGLCQDPINTVDPDIFTNTIIPDAFHDSFYLAKAIKIIETLYKFMPMTLMSSNRRNIRLEKISGFGVCYVTCTSLDYWPVDIKYMR